MGPVPYLELFGVGPVEKNTLYNVNVLYHTPLISKNIIINILININEKIILIFKKSYRVFFSTGPTPKSSRYGTGPTQ